VYANWISNQPSMNGFNTWTPIYKTKITRKS